MGNGDCVFVCLVIKLVLWMNELMSLVSEQRAYEQRADFVKWI